MKKVILCGHTGSDNRGSEALVRSTIEVLRKVGISPVAAATFAAEQDVQNGIDRLVRLIPYRTYAKKQFARYYSNFFTRILHNYRLGQTYIQKPLWREIDSDTLCLNIGGDTYCYSRPYISFGLTSQALHVEAPAVLWGCSLEASQIDSEMLTDLNRYRFLMPREIISYQTLLQAGIPAEKLLQCCDPAFHLPMEPVELPANFVAGNTVGLNVSPMFVKNRDPQDLHYRAVCHAIEYLLENTNSGLCLIPHVFDFARKSEDLALLGELFERYKHHSRVTFVQENYNCMQLKYIISQCRFFVGARTHATIAAYSCEVPTLVLGYSVKSKGIATDLFGTAEGYVLSYEDLKDEADLSAAVVAMMEKEEFFHTRYTQVLPEYRDRIIHATEVLLNQLNFRKEN
jgi:hypothetical protein